MRILGVMSGSSLDGIDLVSVHFQTDDKLEWSIVRTETVAIPNAISTRLSSIVNQTAFEIAEIESLYTKFISNAINDFVKKLDEPPVCASVHGHTVLHLPEIQTSWQLLNGGMCAALTGLDIFCDFRNTDMSYGGQGTPMAVIADRDLFPGYDYYINMGGIVNISYRNNEQWMAYDIAPCNQVSNFYAQQKGLEFDEDGQLAKQGSVDGDLLESLLNDAFIQLEPPKSIDNSWIKDYWIPAIDKHNLKIEDILQTYNRFVIEVIQRQLTSKMGKILITGGGAKNKYFMDLFQSEIGDGFCIETESYEIVDYKESVLMAYLAYLRMNNSINFIGNATGASHDVVGGAWYSGKKL